MPKASLHFQLPDEREEFELALNAGKYLCAMEEFELHFREVWKYRELGDAEQKLVDEIRDLWFAARGDL